MKINRGCSYEGMHIELLGILNEEPDFDAFDDRHRFWYSTPRYNGEDNAIWEIPCDDNNIRWFAKKYGRGQNIMNLWWPDLSRILDCWRDEYLDDIPNLFDKLVSKPPEIPFFSGWCCQHWILYGDWDKD